MSEQKRDPYMIDPDATFIPPVAGAVASYDADRRAHRMAQARKAPPVVRELNDLKARIADLARPGEDTWEMRKRIRAERDALDAALESTAGLAPAEIDALLDRHEKVAPLAASKLALWRQFMGEEAEDEPEPETGLADDVNAGVVVAGADLRWAEFQRRKAAILEGGVDAEIELALQALERQAAAGRARAQPAPEELAGDDDPGETADGS